MRSLRASSSKAKDSDEKRQTQGDRQGRQQRPEEAGLPRRHCQVWLVRGHWWLTGVGWQKLGDPLPPKKFLPA